MELRKLFSGRTRRRQKWSPNVCTMWNISSWSPWKTTSSVTNSRKPAGRMQRSFVKDKATSMQLSAAWVRKSSRPKSWAKENCSTLLADHSWRFFSFQNKHIQTSPSNYSASLLIWVFSFPSLSKIQHNAGYLWPIFLQNSSLFIILDIFLGLLAKFLWKLFSLVQLLLVGEEKGSQMHFRLNIGAHFEWSRAWNKIEIGFWSWMQKKLLKCWLGFLKCIWFSLILPVVIDRCIVVML